MLRTLLSTILILTYSCSHSPIKNKFEGLLASGKCEEALKIVPTIHDNIKLLDKSKEMAGIASSYVATGAAYSVDALVTIGNGIIYLAAFGVLCAAPTLIANQGVCIPVIDNIEDNLTYTKLGKKTYKKTAHWRCPHFNHLTTSILDVSKCYERRGDRASYKKGIKNLQELQNKDKFWECLDSDKKDQVLKLIKRIKDKNRSMPHF